jgi:hypothetical protein
VEQQQIEAVDADPRQAALGRHPQVLAIGLRRPQERVGEAGKAAGPVALTLVEVVADRPDLGWNHGRRHQAPCRG